MTTPLRAPPARILHARYRASRAGLLARPAGPVEAVDLTTGSALTLHLVEGVWTPCERSREPELIGLRELLSPREPPRRWSRSRPQITALVGALAVGTVLAGFARGAIDHGGSAARAIERQATPSAEAAPFEPAVRASPPVAGVRGGAALAVAQPAAPARAASPVVAVRPAIVAPSAHRQAVPPLLPDLPPPPAAIDAMPLPD